MLTSPAVIRVEAQPTAVIRMEVPASKIQEVMYDAISEVLSTVAQQGIAPNGPVFTFHYRRPAETFDFEVGVPVPSPVKPEGRVKQSNLPAKRVARTVYTGPWENLGDAWIELETWRTNHGLEAESFFWESYLRGPEAGGDPSTYQTELTRPLAG